MFSEWGSLSSLPSTPTRSLTHTHSLIHVPSLKHTGMHTVSCTHILTHTPRLHAYTHSHAHIVTHVRTSTHVHMPIQSHAHARTHTHTGLVETRRPDLVVSEPSSRGSPRHTQERKETHSHPDRPRPERWENRTRGSSRCRGSTSLMPPLLLPSPSLIGHRIYRLGSSTLAGEAMEETLRAEQEEGFQCCRHHLTSEHRHCR